MRKDNESVVGALSWLAAQSRPDLQVGVSMAQRKQRAPLLGDIRETNRVVRQAQKGKDYGPTYPRLQEGWDELVLLVFHDAAWANVPAGDNSPDVDEGEATPSSAGRGGSRAALHVEVARLSSGVPEYLRGGDDECSGGLRGRPGLPFLAGGRDRPGRRGGGQCSSDAAHRGPDGLQISL